MPASFWDVAEAQLQEFEAICQRLEAYFRWVIDHHASQFPQYVLEHIPREFQRTLFGFWRGTVRREEIEKVAMQIYLAKLASPVWE
jgi:hypothetical protein